MVVETDVVYSNDGGTFDKLRLALRQRTRLLGLSVIRASVSLVLTSKRINLWIRPIPAPSVFYCVRVKQNLHRTFPEKGIGYLGPTEKKDIMRTFLWFPSTFSGAVDPEKGHRKGGEGFDPSHWFALGGCQVYYELVDDGASDP